MPWPVLLNVNQTVVKPFGQLIEIVEINNVGSNCWVTIDGNYVAGPYQQNVISLPAPESVATCTLTSTAAPGQANPAAPQGVAILHFHPFAPGPLGVNAPLPNPGVIVGGSGWAASAAGNTLTSVAAGDKFLTGQINQLIDLLTGVMTGQAVTFANSLKASGTFEAATTATFDSGLTLSGSQSVVLSGPDTIHIYSDASGLHLQNIGSGATITPPRSGYAPTNYNLAVNTAINPGFGANLVTGTPAAGFYLCFAHIGIDASPSAGVPLTISAQLNTGNANPSNSYTFDGATVPDRGVITMCDANHFDGSTAVRLFVQTTGAAGTATANASDPTLGNVATGITIVPLSLG